MPQFKSGKNCLFLRARFAGLSPWFAPVRRGGGVGGGLHFGLVRRALFIFAPPFHSQLASSDCRYAV
jgi:hypothetical protein